MSFPHYYINHHLNLYLYSYIRTLYPISILSSKSIPIGTSISWQYTYPISTWFVTAMSVVFPPKVHEDHGHFQRPCAPHPNPNLNASENHTVSTSQANRIRVELLGQMGHVLFAPCSLPNAYVWYLMLCKSNVWNCANAPSHHRWNSGGYKHTSKKQCPWSIEPLKKEIPPWIPWREHVFFNDRKNRIDKAGPGI